MKNPRLKSDTRILKTDYNTIEKQAEQRNITVSFLLTLILKFSLKKNFREQPEKTCTLLSMKILQYRGKDLKRVCFTLPESVRYQVRRYGKQVGYNFSLATHTLIRDVLTSGDLPNV